MGPKYRICESRLTCERLIGKILLQCALLITVLIIVNAVHINMSTVESKGLSGYNILIEFGIPINLEWLIKIILIETYSRGRAGKHLPDMFPLRNGLKQGDALSPLLFNFALERFRVNQDGLKLNGEHQLLVYDDDDEVNILGGNVHTINKNAEALVFARRRLD
jgi:hypothetical protein